MSEIKENARPVEKTPREKASLALDWAVTHVFNPSGISDVEKYHSNELHRKAVEDALKEPGVWETLAEDEKGKLEFMGIKHTSGGEKVEK